MPHTNSHSKFADVPLRIRSWVFIIAVFAMAVYNELTMRVFICWVSFQSLRELGKLFSFDRHYLPIAIALLQGVLFFFLPIHTHYLLEVVIILTLGIFYIIKYKTPYVFLSLAIVLFTYPHLAFLHSEVKGLQWLIFLVVTTELNDVFQYLSGKCFGKRKIISKVSPNKTIAGCIGGLLLTPLLSVGLGYLLNLQTPFYIYLLLGLAISFFGFWGDVCISFLKRKAGAKDTGKLIPGHGGLLDRMDSLLFNSIWFFLWIH
ncbi:phosphatidate cytidylyltransferase [Capnocytophaga sp. HP1101]